MKIRSLKFNALISGIQKLLSIIFPLITFPYITRVLQVETIGKINFSNSIVSYFILLAGLGINNYAIREGAAIRNDRKKIEKFASEIFSINLISTIIAYFLLIILYFFWNKLDDYLYLLIIQSITIIGNTIGINWLFSIYENYLYITIRTFIFQLISMILMFVFVKNPNDYYIYTLITVLSNVGANIFNLFYAKKFLKLRLTTKMNLKKHLKPIIIIFSSTIAITVYVNSDITILGWLSNDYTVGIYSVSVKVYSIIKQIISAMIVVALPGMSKLLQDGKTEEYHEKTNNFFNILFLLALPCTIGLYCLAPYIIKFIAGNEFLQATDSLKILSFSIIFSIFSSFVTYVMLLPAKNEKIHLIATFFSALENIALNFMLIPVFKEKAAALTTLLAEASVFIIGYIGFNKKNKKIAKNLLKISSRNFLSGLIECICILILSSVIKLLQLNYIIKMFLIILFALLIYLLISVIVKNDLSIYIFKFLQNENKLKHK